MCLVPPENDFILMKPLLLINQRRLMMTQCLD